MTLKIFISSMMVVCLLATFQPVSAHTLKDTSLFKVTAAAEEGTYHWEYEEPSLFHYEQPQEESTGKSAKQEVMNWYKLLSPNEKTSQKEIITAFKNNFSSPVERVDIRWKEKGRELYTWHWKSK
ncbi:hypothetical protein [Alteribacillus iranensis]|uniref:Uncharacterized protein n=1 Tax=Alteribacillus iranensis TaxID=930128 RepID=A0A1I2CK81_9BACI|nr:hypothetical protein [Alteribacillus iranensis]SFE68110.1 hypothetical protein SAMN05192532_10321 [Alteribacillus iranensis]